MKLLSDLRSEHALIERLVGSLQTFAAARASGAVDPAAGAAYVAFFRLYAGRYHHAREEGVLFPALVREAEVPADRGPLAALAADHAALETLLAQMEPALTSAEPGVGAGELVLFARRHGAMLLHHIDAENDVLFVESEARLAQASVAELPTREPDAEEAAARDAGAALVDRYPPSDIPELWRGAGCVACPAYGERCAGIEREWWSELDWQDFHDRAH
ncbi:MAG: hemerythrin domain-containing protein [Polyangiaceae bacterium]|nr:hemerythrin domain-containing protein [Polyangiaceae bacterium]